MSKLIIIHTIIPDYRKRFFQYLIDQLGDKFIVYSGVSKKVNGFQETEISNNFRLNNYYFFWRKLLFQTGFWGELFSKNIIVLELNPRYITSWIFLIVRRILGQPIILWGHAWPRKGKDSFTDTIRGIQRSLATAIITYSDTQRKELIDAGLTKPIFSAPNALYFKNEIQINNSTRQNILYVGRFIKEKKIENVINAFSRAQSEIDSEAKLVLIGNGPEKENLLKEISRLGLKDKILMPGHINNIEKLKKFYGEALFTVNGGTAGLSIIQSLSFGIPVVLPDKELHGPENEAIKEGVNGLYFKANNIKDLTEKMVLFYKQKSIWSKRSESIQAEVIQNYTVEKMSDVFIKLVKIYGA